MPLASYSLLLVPFPCAVIPLKRQIPQTHPPQFVQPQGPSEAKLSAVVKRLEIVRAERERLANKEKALQEMIINEMIIRVTDTIDVNGHRITSKTVKSTRFDTKSFKVDYAALYNRCLLHGFQTRFNFR